MSAPTTPPPSTDAVAAERHADALHTGLRQLHRSVLDEPMSPVQREAGERIEILRQQNRQAKRIAGVSAGIVLAFGIGWFSHGQLQQSSSLTLAHSRINATPEFVRQAGFAHVVYLPEKRHPVEVTAADEAHLVQWLSKRLAKPLKIPQLDAQGFALVGGRLLPGETGARAQFMFQNTQGQRITLYLGASDPVAPTYKDLDRQATQFRFLPDGPVPSFYWTDQGFGYALSGQVDKATLMQLAQVVYQQIN